MDALSAKSIVSADNDWQIRSGLFLLAAALRGQRNHEKLPEELQNRVQQLDSIYTVLEYVNQHYADKLSVDMAAEIAGYAKTYFCRQFKQATGVSFHRYLNNYRIGVACMLLEDPGLSVAEIAHRTGFSSAKLFCRTFKETTGMTTRQYQKLPPEVKTTHWPR
jgi:AraC-like DNA-binding protein